MKTIKERAQKLIEKLSACRTNKEGKELSWELAEFLEQLANAPEPALSVPDVAQTIPSHDQLTQILDGLDRCWGSESGKREFLRTWIRDWTVHKLAAAPTPAEAPADVARDAWYGSNPPSLVQATAIYMALLESAQNPQKLSDERILELFYEHATPDRWPFGFARAIDAAMREKGGA